MKNFQNYLKYNSSGSEIGSVTHQTYECSVRKKCIFSCALLVFSSTTNSVESFRLTSNLFLITFRFLEDILELEKKAILMNCEHLQTLFSSTY
jgi:hypothetical protein